MRGTLRPIVTKREAGMRWPRRCRRTSDIEADGEIAWSRHPDAGVKLAMTKSQATEANKPGTPRRARISRNPLRRECRCVFGCTCGLPVCVLSAFCCTRGARVQRHPAFPAPSSPSRANDDAKPGHVMPRECEVVSRLRHCERSDVSAVAQRAKAEAIHSLTRDSGLLRRFAPRNDEELAV
jgi:hypothetical protein